MMFIQLAK